VERSSTAPDPSRRGIVDDDKLKLPGVDLRLLTARDGGGKGGGLLG
jgi:hypothetical protein